jgi:hypothetical protein
MSGGTKPFLIVLVFKLEQTSRHPDVITVACDKTAINKEPVQCAVKSY